MDSFDVIVIGGGASGLMAAGRAGEMGKKVLLLEKNRRLGEKLRITGGGRCNITNNEPDLRKLLKNYGASEQFLYSSFSEFGVAETFSFFESLGLPLVTQAKNRVFPKSENALDVLTTLSSYITKNGVKLVCGVSVKKLEAKNGTIVAVHTKDAVYYGRSIIVATGGLSHPETGSTGDGFLWLKSLGHTIHPPTPTIVPIETLDTWTHALAGISLEDAKITFFSNNKKAFSKTGKILCTHFGLSGPLILNSAKEIGDLLQAGTVTATIDLFPTKNIGELDAFVLGIFDMNKNKTLKNVFQEIAPKGTARALLSLLQDVDTETRAHSVSKEVRRQLVDLLKALPVAVKGLMGFDRAVVADGGLDISEVDTRTMRSKKISNLFLTGDILHIERPSGGFSLQLCWTTGYVAGTNA